MPSASQFLHDLFGLQGQHAVVIGGAGVLGQAFSRGLASAGAHVVIAGRDASRGATVAQQMVDEGFAASSAEVDVSDPVSVADLAQQLSVSLPSIDMLINAAGINDGTPYEQVSLEAWEKVLRVNLTGTHLACQAFAPRMALQPEGGSILNIGSVTAHLPLSRVFAYSASKSAIVNLTKNLAREYASRKVRVNVLCPGFLPAEQNRKLLDAQRTSQIIAGTPMARFGEPHELIGAILLLLSRRAGSYLTGSTLYVDGGFTAMRF